MSSFDAYQAALEAREMLVTLIRQTVTEMEPPYRYGTVQTVDYIKRQVTVSFPEGGDPGVVQMGSYDPVVGQVVRVDGRLGDRFVDDVMAAGRTVTVDATGPLSVTTVDQDIPGASYSFTPETPWQGILHMVFDFATNDANVYIGKCVVNGVAQPRQALYGGTTGGRATISQWNKITLAAGVAATIKLQASKVTANGGSVQATHTGFVLTKS